MEGDACVAMGLYLYLYSGELTGHLGHFGETTMARGETWHSNDPIACSGKVPFTNTFSNRI